MELVVISVLVCFFPIKSLNYSFLKQHLYSYNRFSFSWFPWKFLAIIPLFSTVYFSITSPPSFIVLASPHTLSNRLSVRPCICISLSLPVITFCSPGLRRLTRYPLPHIFTARWHTRYLRIHTFIYLWILFIFPLCPSSNLAVLLWFPV